MNLKKWCVEVADYQKRLGIDYEGKGLYGNKETIKCLIIDKVKMIVDDGGRERLAVYSEVLILKTDASVGDLINGRPIEAVSSIKDKTGKVQGMEVYLI